MELLPVGVEGDAGVWRSAGRAPGPSCLRRLLHHRDRERRFAHHRRVHQRHGGEYEALRARDVYLVAGCAAMGGLFLAIGSIIADLLLAAADPRVREGHAE